MVSGEPDSPSDGETSGLKQELHSFLKEASAHAKIRGELLAIESKEAAGLYGRAFGLALAGAILLSVSYFLFLAGAIGILGQLISGSGISWANWIGASWICATPHLIIGLLLIRKSKNAGAGARAHVFEDTRGELKKDQQWLTNERKH